MFRLRRLSSLRVRLFQIRWNDKGDRTEIISWIYGTYLQNRLWKFALITTASLARKSWVHLGRVLDEDHWNLLLRIAGGTDLQTLLCDHLFGANFGPFHR